MRASDFWWEVYLYANEEDSLVEDGSDGRHFQTFQNYESTEPIADWCTQNTNLFFSFAHLFCVFYGGLA